MVTSKGQGFKSVSFHFLVTTMGKLFAQMCLCNQAVYFDTAKDQ